MVETIFSNDTLLKVRLKAVFNSMTFSYFSLINSIFDKSPKKNNPYESNRGSLIAMQCWKNLITTLAQFSTNERRGRILHKHMF